MENFSKVEIKKAVWDCDGNKSPRPDGFNISFIKACWGAMKEDICHLFHEFHNNEMISRCGNASFLVLIPKVEIHNSLIILGLSC